MMTRVQILVPEDQDSRLEALAVKRRESKGKLIRRALDLLLRIESAEEEPLNTKSGGTFGSPPPFVYNAQSLLDHWRNRAPWRLRASWEALEIGQRRVREHDVAGARPGQLRQDPITPPGEPPMTPFPHQRAPADHRNPDPGREPLKPSQKKPLCCNQQTTR